MAFETEIVVQHKDSRSSQVRITYLGRGVYQVRRWWMHSSGGTDTSYTRTYLGARLRAHRILWQTKRWGKIWSKAREKKRTA